MLSRPSLARFTAGLSANVPIFGLALPLGTPFASFLILTPRRFALPTVLRLLILGATAGVVGFALSAMLNGVAVPRSNVGQYISLALFIFGVSRIIGSVRDAASLLVWFSVGSVAYFFIYRPLNTIGSVENLWKYGIAYPVSYVVIYILCSRFSGRYIVITSLCSLGVLSMFLEFRSMALVSFASAVWCVFKKGDGGTFGQALFRAGAATLGISVLSAVLLKTMTNGIFGQVVQLRTLSQTAGDTPLLLGGRTEMPLSLAAILEKPLVGWGDSQTISGAVIAEGGQIAHFMGLSDPASYLPFWIRADGVVSLHSIALNAWVEGGLLGVLLPMLLVQLFLHSVIVCSGKWSPLIVFAGLHGVWDLLFSPWTGNQSIAMATVALLAASVIEVEKRGLAPQNPSATQLPVTKFRLPLGSKRYQRRARSVTSTDQC